MSTAYFKAAVHITLKNPCNELVNIYYSKLTVRIVLNIILLLDFRLHSINKLHWPGAVWSTTSRTVAHNMQRPSFFSQSP